MFTFLKAVCGRALLAAALLAGAPAAWAGPVYRVAIDTSAYSGSGYLDLTLAALGGAAPVTATLRHFTGDYAPGTYVQGDAGGDIGSSVVLGNSMGFNEFLQAVRFGGVFSFEARFDVAPVGAIGTNFGVALVNAALSDYLAGTGGDIVSVALQPGVADQVSVGAGFAQAAVVHEPGTAALLGLGAGVLLLQRPRRRLDRRA